MAYFSISNESGKRHRWTVKIKAAALADCCDERTLYHCSPRGLLAGRA